MDSVNPFLSGNIEIHPSILNAIPLEIPRNPFAFPPPVVEVNPFLRISELEKRNLIRWEIFCESFKPIRTKIVFSKTNEHQTCSICLDEINKKAKVTTCGHMFHFACLNKWAKRKSQCPNCRKDMFVNMKSLFETLPNNEFDIPENVLNNIDEDYNFDESETETNISVLTIDEDLSLLYEYENENQENYTRNLEMEYEQQL